MKKLLFLLVLCISLFAILGCSHYAQYGFSGGISLGRSPTNEVTDAELHVEAIAATLGNPEHTVTKVISCHTTVGENNISNCPVVIIEDQQRRVTNNQEIVKIGVTESAFDNVGQILRVFGAGTEIHTLSARDFNSLDRLQEFYAIFINCGSHCIVDTEVLNAYVKQGGIVYASDHAGGTIQEAFPLMLELFHDNDSQLVADAPIIHSTLASHMRVENLDVIFDLGGWYSITALSNCATVYIEGTLSRDNDTTPLAISFDYGDGRVFYTSFHNSAQTTFHIINFIEYLVFRILNVEADRSLQEAAERDGFQYRGMVFGGAGRAANEMAAEAAQSDDADASFNFFAEAAPSSPSPAMQDMQAGYFNYTFTGQGFMLMFGAGSEFYAVTLIDPNGNRFVVDSAGNISSDTSFAPNATVPAIALTYSDGYRVRVTNITTGQWRFNAESLDGSDIVIGIAVME